LIFKLFNYSITVVSIDRLSRTKWIVAFVSFLQSIFWILPYISFVLRISDVRRQRTVVWTIQRFTLRTVPVNAIIISCDFRCKFIQHQVLRSSLAQTLSPFRVKINGLYVWFFKITISPNNLC